MSDYPIIEPGLQFRERWPPFRTIEVLKVWVDEDGETQVRVHEEPDDSHPHIDEEVRTLTVEDIHMAFDSETDHLEVIE